MEIKMDVVMGVEILKSLLFNHDIAWDLAGERPSGAETR
jgi:hypothetical protein